MENCSGKKHAIVSIYAGGSKPVKVYVPDPPVSVSERVIPGMDGGQCKCVLYEVVFEITYTEHSAWGSYPGLKQGTSFGAAGAIGEFRYKEDGDSIRYYCKTDIDCPLGNPGNEGNIFNFVWVNYRFGIWRQVTATRFAFYRQDGKPDDCGSSPDKCEITVSGSKGVRYKNQYVGKCPKTDVRCDDDCPEGQHRDKSGKCCCNNTKQLKAMTNAIRSDIKGMR